MNFIKRTVLRLFKPEIHINLTVYRLQIEEMLGRKDVNTPVALPMGTVALLFTGLTKRMQFTIKDLRMIQELGFQIHVKKHLPLDPYFS
jgi:hypothetical protein